MKISPKPYLQELAARTCAFPLFKNIQIPHVKNILSQCNSLKL